MEAADEANEAPWLEEALEAADSCFSQSRRQVSSLFLFNAPITPRTHKRLSPFVSVRVFVSSSLITCVYFSPTSFLLFHLLHFLVR